MGLQARGEDRKRRPATPGNSWIGSISEGMLVVGRFRSCGTTRIGYDQILLQAGDMVLKALHASPPRRTVDLPSRAGMQWEAAAGCCCCSCSCSWWCWLRGRDATGAGGAAASLLIPDWPRQAPVSLWLPICMYLGGRRPVPIPGTMMVRSGRRGRRQLENGARLAARLVPFRAFSTTESSALSDVSGPAIANSKEREREREATGGNWGQLGAQ